MIYFTPTGYINSNLYHRSYEMIDFLPIEPYQKFDPPRKPKGSNPWCVATPNKQRRGTRP